MLDLNRWSKKIHEHNKEVGWWDNNPCIYEKLQLVSTEIAEATEAERKDAMDDKLPHRKGGEVELADALIRVLDIGGYLGLTYDFKDKFLLTYFDEGVASFHLSLNEILLSFSWEIRAKKRIKDLSNKQLNFKKLTQLYSGLVFSLVMPPKELLNYDIEAAMIEKFEYNKTRADHKRENRAKEGGKKF